MICGIDEAGRGPLAGPVFAAAVILGPAFSPILLNDSKKLTPARRERAEAAIRAGASAWGIGWASHEEIDAVNILRASLLAMKRAVEELLKAAAERGLTEDLEAIVDGLYTPDITIPCRAMVKADARIPEVMAASILAKTARDREMTRYALLYPGYGYERHKGYPTKAHRQAIARLGPSPIQRLSFTVTYEADIPGAAACSCYR
ncbi:MAG: ribonuclease HII [Treponema sp.]|jgi:ribonuclease HII|nr:ribonuclease HII [Treponema sp.]